MKKSTNETNQSSSTIWRLLPWLLLAVCYIGFIFWQHLHVDALLDSDLSSELRLARILAEQHKILTTDWLYSSELRILNTNLVYGFVSMFTTSWHAVRVISCAILNLILLAAYYYLFRKLGCENYYALCGSIVMQPLSKYYYDIVIGGMYYIPHISISLVTVGMLFGMYEKAAAAAQNGTQNVAQGATQNAVRKDSKSHGNLLRLLFLALLALLSGMGGPRQPIILYGPLFFAACVWLLMKRTLLPYVSSEEKYAAEKLPLKELLRTSAEIKLFWQSGLLLFISAFGYLINLKVLSKFFSFEWWTEINYHELHWDDLVDVLNGLLRSMGYRNGGVMGSASIPVGISLIVFVAIGITMFCNIKNHERTAPVTVLLSLFNAFALLLLILLYAMTDQDLVYRDRYNLPYLAFTLPILALQMKNLRWKPCVKQVLAVFGVLCCLASGLLMYHRLSLVDNTSQLKEFADLMTANDIHDGYATFWNGNILTEVSNGAIDMRVWCDAGSSNTGLVNITDVDTLYEWLQPTSHKYTVPEGYCFVLFKKYELENTPWAENLQNSGHEIWRSQDYIAYGWQTHDEMKAMMEAGLE